jgi:hypothetical protein
MGNPTGIEDHLAGREGDFSNLYRIAGAELLLQQLPQKLQAKSSFETTSAADRGRMGGMLFCPDSTFPGI